MPNIPQEASALIEMLGYGGALYTENGTRWSKGRLLAETTGALNSAVERETGILNEIREATRLEFVKRVAAMEKELREKDAEIERLRNEIARLNNQSCFVCECGGTKKEGT